MSAECMASITQQVQDVALLSGNSIMKIGLYNQCLQKPGMLFNLVTIQMPGLLVPYIGLCLP